MTTSPMTSSPSTSPAANPFAAGCAWVEGEYLPVHDARIPLRDNGFNAGDLTYDVVAVWDGAFFRLEDHLDRLLRGCERLRFTPQPAREQVREIMLGMVRRAGLREAYVNVIVTRGVPAPGQRDPRQITTAVYGYALPYIWLVPPDRLEAGVDMIVTRDVTRIPPSAVDPTIKNYHWGDLVRGQFEAYDRGGSYCLLTDGQGGVTEGAGYNVFAVVDGTLYTPTEGVLLGITRKVVLEIAEELGIPAVTGRMPVELAERADEIFMTSTAGGVMAVATLDGRPLGAGSEGPTTRRIRDRYWEWHHDPRHIEPVDYGAGAGEA